jgi:hypothetical protein
MPHPVDTNNFDTLAGGEPATATNLNLRWGQLSYYITQLFAAVAAITGIGGSTGANDNRLMRSDGAGGATIQSSVVTVDDTGIMSGATISHSTNTIVMGSGVIKTLASDVAAAGADRNLIIAAQTGTSDNLIEVTGLSVGESVLLRADTGDTITVVHNSGGATVKIHLHGNANIALDEQNPLRLTLVATNVLVEDGQGGGGISFAILADEKAANTAGGSASATTWNARNLNTEIVDDDAIVSISSNQFTPISGTYRIVVAAPAYKTGMHRLRLYNVTGAASVKEGQNARSGSADDSMTNAYLEHVFTANGTDAYRIDHYTVVAAATNGLGVQLNVGGASERYTMIYLEKLS